MYQQGDKVYKIVRRVVDENDDEVWRLYSAIIGHPNFSPNKYPQLEYLEGRITQAPEGTAGIFVYPSLDDMGLRGLLDERGGEVFQVHEATVVLPPQVRNSNPEAILLGPRVEVVEDAPPEPRWVDVTDECEVTLQGKVENYPYILLRHGRRCVAGFGLSGHHVASGGEDDYKIREVGDYGCFRVFKKETTC